MLLQEEDWVQFSLTTASKILRKCLFHHKETSQLTCSANQWTGFYMITISVKKELRTRNLYSILWGLAYHNEYIGTKYLSLYEDCRKNFEINQYLFKLLIKRSNGNMKNLSKVNKKHTNFRNLDCVAILSLLLTLNIYYTFQCLSLCLLF